MIPNALRCRPGWKTLSATVACAATVSLLTGPVGPAAASISTSRAQAMTAPHAATHTVTLITAT
ncbi:hypothetical protein OHS70_33535 [Streptomyces sp. NBC_00390]|uniref:hypothetical protein n=1 Tax=Streptomyces sp. NBC_00390 TaxID=2975736 RepID=UPI002E21CAE1